MASKQKKSTESEAIAVVDEALNYLPDNDSRERVLGWALAKYGATRTSGGVPRGSLADAPQPLPRDASEGHGPRAKAWIKKHNITSQALDSAFHFDGETSTLILKAVKGASKREKLRNVAAVLGAMGLVKMDQPRFTAAEFREALKQYGAYDSKHGPTYVKAHKDVIQGTSSVGFTVTSIGLDLAAALLTTVGAE